MLENIMVITSTGRSDLARMGCKKCCGNETNIRNNVNSVKDEQHSNSSLLSAGQLLEKLHVHASRQYNLKIEMTSVIGLLSPSTENSHIILECLQLVPGDDVLCITEYRDYNGT